MTVLVTGGTGFVGRFIIEHLLQTGHDVIIAGRTPPSADFFSRAVTFRPLLLEPGAIGGTTFAGVDAVVHAAFDHVPGRYRGGEGADPDGFRRRNLDGSAALFHAAKQADISHCVFLSSRAVYGTQPPGALLTEETEPHPDTLYGEVKLEAEQILTGLAAPGFRTTILRTTGVYGPPPLGKPHKWERLFDDYIEDKPIAPRCGTEVHGSDVAKAVELVLQASGDAPAQTFNVSDILVDRRDILAIFKQEAGSTRLLPAAGDAASYNQMSSEELKALGWRPGGQALFENTVRRLARDYLSNRPNSHR
jgi:nucleoside-diphosphate-sugar epimerase